jgi:hypothetical protein
MLLAELTKAANSRQLKADKVIEDLFRVATTYPMQEELVSRAQLRMSLGNPPGKNGSLGDAVNWETLLDKAPYGEDLYFISDDKDFRSAIDDTQFSQFLTREWAEKKSSGLRYYNRLSAFFADYYPNIRLATEKEMERLIGELAASASFAETHSIITKFRQYTDFTNDQVDKIVAAIVSNNQVYWIVEDEDVNQFVLRVIEGHEAAIDDANLARLQELLQEVPKDEPFAADDEEIAF